MSKLAINGGLAEASQLTSRIPEWPIVTEDDKKAVMEVLESRRWCRVGGVGQGVQSSKSKQLENIFSEYQNANYGIAVANGTVALELALKTLGVGYGDEIIVPAVTFIATASAVTNVGAIPVFADIDPATGNTSPESLKQTITDKTKAVVVVHYGGYPADFDAILPLTKKVGIHLVEDCAQAHGSEWRGRRVGAIGDMGAFSFQESKSITAGEGGMVLTDNFELAERSRLIHNIGRVLGKPGYEHHVLSSNYRITEFQSALLLSKMKTLPQMIAKKHSNGAYLASKMKKIGGVEPARDDPRVTQRGYYLFVVRYDQAEFDGLSKQKFAEALNAEGVPTYYGYGKPLYKQFAFRKENLKGIFRHGITTQDYQNLNLPGAEEFTARELTLMHPVLLVEREDLDLIVNSVEKIKDNLRELL